jgi:diaminohydroxyphosphoribosylaminopyrimidine deaminase/5-amino-6-(5-phosphoribosylamino)uracil reductase
VEAERFMREALRLAGRACGKTSPNPLVGAVVVKRGKIVGRGYHKRFGSQHAESSALGDAGVEARGSALYVNLEPCCHFGHTPPCVDKIVESGVSEVYVGVVDPDERVRGKGLAFLKRRGVRVETGILKREAERLNEAYLKWAREGLPFVALKVCQSLDGRLAAAGGQSRGLGSPEEIEFVHSLRARYDAVLVGAGTVVSDNPRLTVRKVKGRNPHRIVVDSRLRSSPESRVFVRRGSERIIVAALASAPRRRVEALRSRGCEVWFLPGQDGRVSLKHLLARAAGSLIQSVLVEGGGEVVTAFLRRKLADKMYVAVAPKILGGSDGTWPADVGVKGVEAAVELSEVRTRRLGTNLLIEGYL